MNKLIKLILVLPVLLALLLAGCTVDAPDSSTDLVAPSGAQLFDSYVAIGNSLTAGFMDGGLVINGQMNSYPKLIAGQIGATDFTQPYISFPGVGSSRDPENHPADAAGVLYWNGSAPTVVDWTPLATVIDPTSGFLLAIAQPTPYHNLGVPGATLHDVMNAYSSATSTPPGNSYFDFINRATLFDNVSVPEVPGVSPAYETASMFRAAVAKGPKLLTCWIGNNDVLGPAMNGTDQGTTDLAVFQAKYTALIGALGAGAIQSTGWPPTIVLANIPRVIDTPYFVDRDFVEAAAPNGLGIVWPAGYEETGVSLVCFPALAWFQDTDNLSTPVPASLTLTAAEASAIDATVMQYNSVIEAVATGVTAQGYAKVGVVDAYAELAGLDEAQRTHFMFLEPALGVDAAAATTVFSLDGVHLNNVGYGIMANHFIAKINELEGTNVPPVDISGLSWDPTYGQTVMPGAKANLKSFDMQAAEAMQAVWR